MSNQRVPVAEWARQLSDLAIVAGFTSMALPRPNPGIKALPAIEIEKPVEPPHRKSALPPEVQEFMRYPPEMQRQALSYLKKWHEGVSR